MLPYTDPTLLTRTNFVSDTRLRDVEKYELVMSLKRIRTESSNSDELPWVSDYVMEDPERIDTALWTEEIFQTPKGYLVVTSSFKGFIFTNSSMFSFLREALELWIGGVSTPYPLFAIASRSGKIELAIDDEMPRSWWTKDGRRWIQKRGKDKGSSLTSPPVNPLISSPSQTSGGTRAKRTKDTDEYPPLDRTSH